MNVSRLTLQIDADIDLMLLSKIEKKLNGIYENSVRIVNTSALQTDQNRCYFNHITLTCRYDDTSVLNEIVEMINDYESEDETEDMEI